MNPAQPVTSIVIKHRKEVRFYNIYGKCPIKYNPRNNRRVPLKQEQRPNPETLPRNNTHKTHWTCRDKTNKSSRKIQ